MAARLVGLGEWLFPRQNGNIAALNKPCGRGGRSTPAGCGGGDGLGVPSVKKPIVCQGEFVEGRPLVHVKNRPCTTKYLPCASG